MKAAVVYQPGGPEALVVEEREKPELKEGWSLVEILGFGLNHSEIFTRQGLSPSVTFPRILGIECVGQIAETTSDDFQIGQTVISIMGEMGRDFDGSYAEYTLLPNSQIYPVESQLPLEQLVALPETYYTAYGALKNLQIKAGDTTLIRGAASGVGIAMLRLIKAKFPNNQVYGSSRSLLKEKELLQKGFDGIIVDQQNTLQTSRSFDKILELIGPASIKDSFSHINEHGIVCSNGQLGGKWYLEEFDPIMELKNNSYLTSFYSGIVSQKGIQELLDYVSQYHVDVRPEKIFSLEQIAEAHSYLESRSGLGKVIVLNQIVKDS
ncbi:zinc-binding alcohol dehydrogenase family protein [Streptococcus pantholopis]|uniref:Quinone oxidoreductase n=1 Tax=Streptococcus pantholopis TaxID=1811193 RepID=A0A172Q6G9_9STRE|nr:zinc-binding alcohol dehydrogenase family protein [Streptococcus pantholopis]AND79056.1 quinone oxidoreductase [Streptococcus pantholopis]